MSETGCFGGDALEDVVNERVHDAHGFAGDTSVRVNLLQHFVDVDGIAFSSPSTIAFAFPAFFSPFFPATLAGILLNNED